MKSNFLAASLALLVMGMLVVVESRAEPSSANAAEAKEKARVHFEQGVKFAREGKLEAAVAEFEGAYRIRPHYSVLYNLGQARAAMGHSVEAVDAFRQYLEDGGKSIDAGRRANVVELIAFHEKRIGSLQLDVEPEGAEVWLDGHLIGTSPLSGPVKLVEGSHGVVVRKNGLAFREKAVEITAGSKAELALRAESRSATTESAGVLLVRCGVPDVEVSIGGSVAGMTSSDRVFRAPIGRSDLSLARSGYVTDTRSIEITPDRPAEVSCQLEQDGKSPRGALQVSARPADGTVWVNGKRFRGEALPTGRHSVRVERQGYHPWTAFVRVEAARTAQVDANLKPTKEQRDAWQAERSNRTTWAIATTIAGVVLAGAGVATYVWNSERYEDWVSDRQALDAKLAQGSTTAAMLDENAALNQRSLSIDRADAAALGLGVAGAVTLGISSALWIRLVEGTGGQ